MRIYEFASTGGTSSGGIATVATSMNSKPIKRAYGETTNVTDYNPPSHGGTRKELLAKYAKSKSSADATNARKAGASQKELQQAKNS